MTLARSFFLLMLVSLQSGAVAPGTVLVYFFYVQN